MKNSIIAVIILLTACTSNNQIKTQLLNQHFWINDSIQWKTLSPGDTSPSRILYGNSSVYYFLTDSSFRKVDNMVEKQNNKMLPSLGTYESIYEGNWKIENNKIIISQQLVYKTFLSQIHDATGAVDTAATIKFYTQMYHDTLTYSSGSLTGTGISLNPTTLDTTQLLYKLIRSDWAPYRTRLKHDLIQGASL